jgi:hypothetical protein
VEFLQHGRDHLVDLAQEVLSREIARHVVLSRRRSPLVGVLMGDDGDLRSIPIGRSGGC